MRKLTLPSFSFAKQAATSAKTDTVVLITKGIISHNILQTKKIFIKYINLQEYIILAVLASKNMYV